MQLMALEKIVQTEEVAQATRYLMSDASFFITGTTLVLNGGQMACYEIPLPRPRWQVNNGGVKDG